MPKQVRHDMGLHACGSPNNAGHHRRSGGKNLNILKTGTDTDSIGERFLIYLNDGGILAFRSYLYDVTYYLDGKAYKNPQEGINWFGFSMYAESSGKKPFEPYAFSWNGTEQGFLTGSYRCGSNRPSGNTLCTKWIQYNNWEIPKNYPLKF